MQGFGIPGGQGATGSTGPVGFTGPIGWFWVCCFALQEFTRRWDTRTWRDI